MQQEGDTVSVPLLTIIDRLGGPEGVQKALFKYAKAGNPLGVQLALQAGADVQLTDDKEGYTPLAWAAQSGDEATVRILIAAGSVVDVKGHEWTPLMHAAAYSQKKVTVTALLEAGASLDTRSYDGWTALICAGSNSGPEGKEIVEMLLAAGADPNAVQSDGYTALTQAAEDGLVENAKVLIAAGADVNLKCPLRVAAYYGQKEMVEFLLRSDAKVDTNDDENTPLMKAITSESANMEASGLRTEIIQILLAHNPNLAARSRDGKSALTLARETKDDAVIQAVEAAYRKKINIPLSALREVFGDDLAGIVEVPQIPGVEQDLPMETPPPPR